MVEAKSWQDYLGKRKLEHEVRIEAKTKKLDMEASRTCTTQERSSSPVPCFEFGGRRDEGVDQRAMEKNDAEERRARATQHSPVSSGIGRGVGSHR